jgi:hypothetical protein
VDPGSAVNEQPRFFVIQGLLRKIHAALKQLRRLGLKVIVRGVP